MHLPDIFSATESAEPAYRADPIDEYRDLAMLAQAWEQSLEPQVAEQARRAADDVEEKGPARR